MTPRRIVTLPPAFSYAEACAFAADVRRRGAALLELRTDLHPPGLDPRPLAAQLPLLVAERAGRAIPRRWKDAAELIDGELEAPGALDATLLSHHAERPLAPDEALHRWERAPLGRAAALKHIEPAGAPGTVDRLLETRTRLQRAFPGHAITVLPMGPLALPFRAVMAAGNALDYLAASGAWASAPGQRLLDDAVRAARGEPSPRGRLGILGTGIGGSRSPRIHAPPFDRIDLPEEAPIAELLAALRPHYRGFAVTSPFKAAAAKASGATLPAVNTLLRTADGYRGENTDVAGARVVFERLGPEVTVLGDGGATTALRLAAAESGTRLTVLRRDDVGRPVSGDVVWTWPDRIPPPAALRFQRARVAVIAYGAAARRLRDVIRGRGGEPVLLGAPWFVAQARAQRLFWEQAA